MGELSAKQTERAASRYKESLHHLRRSPVSPVGSVGSGRMPQAFTTLYTREALKAFYDFPTLLPVSVGLSVNLQHILRLMSDFQLRHKRPPLTRGLRHRRWGRDNGSCKFVPILSLRHGLRRATSLVRGRQGTLKVTNCYQPNRPRWHIFTVKCTEYSKKQQSKLCNSPKNSESPTNLRNFIAN